MNEFATQPVIGLLAALGGGLLVGVERERRKGDGSNREPAGVRTFTLVALLGAIAAQLGQGVVLLSVFSVAVFAVAGYLRRIEYDPGLTTEIALLATLLLGVLAMSTAGLASGLFVALAILLQSKQALHHFTRQVLSERELDDALVLAASVLIVLPLLPDVAIDPLDVINPRKLWLFAVLVMTINALGYIALRALGNSRGFALAGFLGGFVSSAATIAGMGQRAASDPTLRSACIAAALLSNVATMIQLALILLAVSPDLLRHIALPLFMATITAVLIAARFVWHSHGTEQKNAQGPQGRPFALLQAITFAAIVTSALLVAAVLRLWFGESGVFVAATAAGFADVHAAAVTVGQLVRDNNLGIVEASFALAAAFTANSLVKCGAAWMGGAGYAWPVMGGVATINAVLAAAIWLSRA